MESARSTEIVLVEFDVNEEGRTENIRIVDSTMRCLETASIRSVEKWDYEPKMRDGVAVRRAGVQTQITFELAGSGVALSPQDEIGRAVWFKMSSVRSGLLKGRSPDVLLADLDEIERKYGADFTKSEQAVFHQIRAGVRIKAQDYAGALDDLRIVKRSNEISDKKTREAIDKTIAQLEAIVDPPLTEDSPSGGGP